MDAESMQEPADLGDPFLRILVEVEETGCELVAKVTVGEAMQGMLAAHQGREELTVRPGEKNKGLHGSCGERLLAGGDGVQRSQAWRGVVDLGQGLQIPRVALEADLAVADEINHALPQRHPQGGGLPAAPAHAASEPGFLWGV